MSPLEFLLVLVIGFVLAFLSHVFRKWKDDVKDDPIKKEE